MGGENCAITKMAGKYPQDIYAAVVLVILLEWIFLQCMTKDMGYAFAGVEKIFQETFSPHIFFRKYKYLPPIVLTLITMSVNKYGLGLEDLMTSANKKYLSLLHPIRKLIGAVTGEREFSTADNHLVLREERLDRQKNPLCRQ